MTIPTAILIIAAGSSSRLGQPKQLLPYRAHFLLHYMVSECLAANLGAVFVVLGANKEQIAPRLATLDCSLLYNPSWEQGMGTSIACGMAHLANMNYKGVFVVLSDQVFFKKELLHQLIRKQATTKAPLVISKYTEGMGPPAFFTASLFDELSQLEGDIGAKAVVKKYAKEFALIPFEKGHLDIDTKVDLIHLKQAEEREE